MTKVFRYTVKWISQLEPHETAVHVFVTYASNEDEAVANLYLSRKGIHQCISVVKG